MEWLRPDFCKILQIGDLDVNRLLHDQWEDLEQVVAALTETT